MEKLKFLGLIVALFLAVPHVRAQEEQTVTNPRASLAAAKVALQNAIAENDSPAVVDAFMTEYECLKAINQDSIPAFLSRLEAFIEASPRVVERSVLHALLAELYTSYYDTHYAQINNRTDITGYVPQSIDSWTVNIFREQILEHLRQALSPREELLRTSTMDYEQALKPGKDSPHLRPTLYDFLAYRSLDLLTNYHQGLFSSRVKELATKFVCPTEEFINLPLEGDETGIFTLKLFQELLRSQLERGENDALILTEINRLSFIQNLGILTKLQDSIFHQLELLREKYADNPYSVEIAWTLAKAYFSTWEMNQDALTYNRKALVLCEDGIRRFPDYFRINILKNLRDQILEPTCSTRVGGVVYPGKSLEIEIDYRNLSSISYTLYKINQSTEEYVSGDLRQVPRQRVLTRATRLPNLVVRQDSTLLLPIKDVGLYELIVRTPSANGECLDTLTFFCTRLAGINHQRADFQEVWVCDRLSGEPVPGARVKVFKEKGFRDYQLLKEVTTDANGIAAFDLEKDLCYQVVTDDDNHGPITDGVFFWPNEYKPGNVRINLFSDRTIYRPGQTVYFKGICWQEEGQETRAIPNHEVEISLNGNGNDPISKQTLTTNEFGSFAGEFKLPTEILSGYFSISINNQGVNFRVMEYKRPSFEILFDPIRTAYQFGDRLHVTGRVKSFSNIPLSDCRISYAVYPSGYRNDNKKPVAVGKLQTNAQGIFEFSFLSDSTHFELPVSRYMGENYAIRVEVTSPNGETHTETNYLSISSRPYSIQFIEQNRYNRDELLNLRVQTLNAEYLPVSAKLNYTLQAVELTSVPRDEFRQPEYTVGKTWAEGTYTTPETLTLSLDTTLHLDARQFPSGAYLLTLSGTGNQQNISSKNLIYLYSREDTRPPCPSYNWAIPVKTTCALGEEAEFIFGTSATNAHVLYEIYAGDQLVKREIIPFSNENRAFRVPYEASFGPACQVFFTYLKDDELTTTRFDLKRADTDKTLNIVTSTFRDHLRPGQTEEWTFTVTDRQGEPVVAEWLASMYDKSIYEYGDNTWDFNPQPVAFRLNDNWTHRSASWLSFYRGTSFRKETRQPLEELAFQFDTWKITIPGVELDNVFYCRGIEPRVGAFGGVPGIIGPRDPAAAKTDAGNAETMVVAFGALSESDKQRFSNNLPLRQNFRETAFFYPQLRTDSLGRVVVRFTVPESTTAWHFQALAHTPDLHHGYFSREVITAKEFMVSTNLPRFVRSGDQVVLQTTINNLAQAQSGDLVLELFDPATDEIISRQSRAFQVDANANQTLAFTFDVPDRLDAIGCRVVASAGDFSDGEQHLLPVAPRETLVTQSIPLFLSEAGDHKLRPKFPAGSRPYRLTLEMTANPAWYAVLALPTLNESTTESATSVMAAYYANTLAAGIARSNPAIGKAIAAWSQNPTPATTSPLALNEELKSIILQLTPWVAEAGEQTAQMQSLANLFDQNRQHYLASVNLTKLRELQNADGGWTWFKGFSSNLLLTERILADFARLVSLGVLSPDEQITRMQTKALAYVDNAILARHQDDTVADHLDLLYLATRGAYRDIPLGDVLPVHKALMRDAATAWPGYTLVDKAFAALALHRYGDDTTARAILASLLATATTTPDQGTFWANNRSLLSAGSAISVHATLMTAFREIMGDTPETDRMKQWLLAQKQTQDWGDVPSTVDAIHAILLTGSDHLAAGEQLAVRADRRSLDLETADARLGCIKQTLPTDTKRVTVTKQTDTPSWGALYLQYFQPLDEASTRTAGLSLEKQLFVKRTTPAGVTLEPLPGTTDASSPLVSPSADTPSSSASLKVGDRLTVRLVLRNDRDLEFVHLRDLRAACLEPIEQKPGARWQNGLRYYQETRDVSMNFFFDFLPRGTHVLEYDVWIAQSGEYTDGIASLQCVYAPQFSANSSAGRITVAE